MVPGEYTLTWGNVDHWVEPVPNPETQMLVAGETITFAGLYEPVIPPEIVGVVDVDNDQGRHVRITFRRCLYDVPGDSIDITGYGIYRRQDEWKGAALLPQRDTTGKLLGWDYLGTLPARQDSAYQYVAETLCDSTLLDGVCWSVFMVSATTPNAGMFFDSRPDSGYSVDNIAPGVPQGLLAGYKSGGVSLDWEDAPESDFQYHRVYRGSSPDFVPTVANFVHETASSAWTDPTANPWGHHYKVTTLDHAGNESEAASPTEMTGVLDGTVPTRTALLGAVPNPFNPSTRLSFEMGETDHAQLKVYDAAGRLVATLVDEIRDAGQHAVVWDGRDALGRMSSAGVYLYRLEVGGYSESKRIVLIK